MARVAPQRLKDLHQISVLSKRQQRRIEAGRVESKPSDYREINPSESKQAEHAARKRIEEINEERAMADYLNPYK